MSEKLHNDEFDVKRTDGNVLSGDSNKIKLKITSYAVMMEVQEAYMKEERAAKEKEKKDLEQQLENEDLSRKERREIKKNISYLADDLEIMTDVYAAFSKSRQRFMEIAKKALKLPEENLKQLAENGSIEIEGEKINIEEAMKETQSILTDTMENEDVFSSVDSNLIRQEVERAMNEEEKDEVTGKINNASDFIESKLNENPDTFDDIVKAASAGVKENVDEVKKDEITFADADDIFNRARNITIEPPKKAEKPLENIPTPLNKGIEFDFPTGEWNTQSTDDEKDEEEAKTPIENNESIFGQDQPTAPEYNIPNTTQNQNVSETERRYTTLGKVHNNQSVDFGGDTTFEQLLTSRQERLNEKSKKVSSLRTEVDTLEQTKKEKEKRLDEATRKKEQEDAEMVTITKHLEELKRLDEEEAKLSSEETTLNDRKSELNSEISGYDEKIDEIEKQNATNLEKYRALQEEINKYIKGKTSDDDIQYGGVGGRTM